MSKPVRIRGDVAARVDVVAALERRSFANMVEVLLLAALEERDGVLVDGRVEAAVPFRSSSAGSVPTQVQDGGVRSRPHMKKGRPAVECPTRWPSGVCPDCGQEL